MATKTATVKQPEFSQPETEVILAHVIWSKTRDEIKRLLDGPGDTVWVRLFGRTKATPGVTGEITIRIPKTDAVNICEHPSRTEQRQIAEYGYEEVMSRIFNEPPMALLSVGEGHGK